MKTTVVKVDTKYQINIPKSVREQLNVKVGDRLLVDVQYGIMILIPQPKSYTNHLQGLHSEIWEDVDAQEYVSREREAWKNYV